MRSGRCCSLLVQVQDRMLQLDNPASIKAAAIKAAKAKQRSQHKRKSTAPRAESAAVARAHAKELSRLPKDQQRWGSARAALRQGHACGTSHRFLPSPGQTQGCTCRYELYQPLNVLWQAYAGKLLQSPNMGDLLQVRVSTTGMASIYAQHDMLLPCLNALFVIV